MYKWTLLVAGTAVTLIGSLLAAQGAILGALTAELIGGLAIVLAIWIRGNVERDRSDIRPWRGR
jgi:hypothetical protein